MMIGTDDLARSWRQTSKPCASGSPRSSSTRSGSGAARAAAAELTCCTSKPSRSRPTTSGSAMSSSSSTSSTLMASDLRHGARAKDSSRTVWRCVGVTQQSCPNLYVALASRLQELPYRSPHDKAVPMATVTSQGNTWPDAATRKRRPKTSPSAPAPRPWVLQLAIIALAIGFGATIALAVTDTTWSQVKAPGGAWIFLGSLTGRAGRDLALVMVLFVSRVAAVE